MQVLVGDRIAAESPNPRGRVTGVAEQVDGRRLDSVDAVGKNLVLRFEGGVTVRSHLRMSGRWRVTRRDAPVVGSPWLVLRGSSAQAILYGGRVLELSTRALDRLGPDILADAPDFSRMLRNLRREHPTREVGDALLDQRLVAGIGNKWKAEALWAERVSPWRPLGEVTDEELRRVLEWAAHELRLSVETGRSETHVLGRAGRPCSRCQTPIRSHGQGDDNRTAYWCPACQPGPDPALRRARSAALRAPGRSDAR
jgi:endonuclease-8